MKSFSALVSKTFFVLFLTLVSITAAGENLPVKQLILAGPASMVQNTCYQMTLSRQGDYNIASAQRETVLFSYAPSNVRSPYAVVFAGNQCSGLPQNSIDIPAGQASIVISISNGGYLTPNQLPLALSLNAVSQSKIYASTSLNFQLLGPSLKLEGPSQMVQNTCYQMTLSRQGDYNIASAPRETVQFSYAPSNVPLPYAVVFAGNQCSGLPQNTIDIPTGQASIVISISNGGYLTPNQLPLARSLNAVSISKWHNPASLNFQLLGPSLKLEGPSQMVQNTCYQMTLSRQGDYNIASAQRETVQFSYAPSNVRSPYAVVFAGNQCSGLPQNTIDIPAGQASIVISISNGGYLTPNQLPLALSLNAVSISKWHNPASLNFQLLGPSLKLEGPSQMVQNTCYQMTLSRIGGLDINYASTWVSLDYPYPFEISLDTQCSGSLARSIQIPAGQKSVTLSIKSKYLGSGSLKASADYGYSSANIPLQVR